MAVTESSPEASSGQSRWTFILVCANFTMLAVLFIGIGILLFQSISLVSSLKSDLKRAEQSVVQLRARVEQIDAASAVERIVESAVGSIREEVSRAVNESEPLAKLSTVPENIETMAAAAEDVATRVREIDADAIAQRVSYELLKGLSEGLGEAAEQRKPGG